MFFFLPKAKSQCRLGCTPLRVVIIFSNRIVNLFNKRFQWMRFTFECINAFMGIVLLDLLPTDATLLPMKKNYTKFFDYMYIFLCTIFRVCCELVRWFCMYDFFSIQHVFVTHTVFFKSKKFGTSNSVIRILFNKQIRKTCGFCPKLQTFCQCKQQNAFIVIMWIRRGIASHPIANYVSEF